jgi:hypothetical protein
MDHSIIDITHDFSEDYKNNIDPDRHNRILRNWHKMLWNKALPNGNKILTLIEKDYGLYHNSLIGEYYLTSDSIVHTYSRQKSMVEIIKQIPKIEIDEFLHIASRIGGYIIFPGNRIQKYQTINGARGFNPKIADRFDLTLECIRLYYNGEINIQVNPLGETINRYSNFFKLFIDFKNYCDFFFLQDLTIDNYSQIKYFLPFTGFTSKPRPSSVQEYQLYKKNNIHFVNSRNNRILEYFKKTYDKTANTIA